MTPRSSAPTSSPSGQNERVVHPNDRVNVPLANKTDEALREELRLCRTNERIVKPNKARRSWNTAAERIEAELERRGLSL